MADPMYIYVGTYTRSLPHVQAKSEGIYLLQMDPTSGALTMAGKTTGVENPSYLTIHPNGRYLYAVNEVGDFGGKENSGAVSAFAIDPASGALTFLNQEATDGAAPCHLNVDATGRYLLTANYSGGSVAVHPIKRDGSLGKLNDFVQHAGSSVNEQRQKEPHAHSFTLAPDNRFAYCADLGTDKVVIYAFDSEQGKLSPAPQAWVRVHPGAGPRHFDFHPNGRYAYSINELDSTMTVFAYEMSTGRLTELQSVPTLPAGFDGRSHCADIHVHPSGNFVYGSNRGHDSIAIFAIDQSSGLVNTVGHEATQGKIPRNFVIDPTGTFLLAANQNTDSVVVFRIDQQRGHLTPTGQMLDVPTPVCLKFWSK